ncbi:uncharacterized protein FTJAE_1803 [Fusarium tjaetaba]|uniref:Xylanolytic transcriptional activator regulatory domain-containing protein n=1 Tax=Fusarium tjaetaba TaxID=1567544 RepID=A0A8H5SA61_9HYPO|nr:uncharacterized protein FTJAE_1803 [Fusarium tjaetaba]KAF5646972.1 hypothetical protein FTJAE_1803 [Fusarium tjaetaba]
MAAQAPAGRLLRGHNPATRKKPSGAVGKISISYFVAICFIGIHAAFFAVLNNRPVNTTIGQGLSTALANILAIFVEVSLLGGLGLAYNQILARFLGQKSFYSQDTKLHTLASSPWNLFRPRVLAHILHIKRLWLVGFLCAGIPFAAVFPPGALTVKFENSVPLTMNAVPTINISDYGNGTYQDFVEKSFFEMNADLSYMNQLRPSLNALAAQVLSSGRPVKIDSPCGASCVYDISIEGPLFNCQELSRHDVLSDGCSVIYRAADEKDSSPDEPYSRTNNSFKISWYTDPRPVNCTSLNSSQSIDVQIENKREVWSEKAWIQTQFFYYFFYGGGITPRLANDTLKANFTNAQSYAISRAAVHALQGEVEMHRDGPGLGRKSDVLGTRPLLVRDASSARPDAAASNHAMDVVKLARDASIHGQRVIDLRVVHQRQLFQADHQSDNSSANPGLVGFVSRELDRLFVHGGVSPEGALETLDHTFWCQVLEVYEEEVDMMYPFLEISQLRHEILDRKTWSGFDYPRSSGFYGDVVGDIAFLVLAIVSSFEASKAVEIVSPVVEKSFVSTIPKIHLQSPNLGDLTLLALICIFFFLNDREKEAWRLIGTIMRLVHEQSSQEEEAALEKISDTFFWSLYTLDRRWSFGTGLPFAVQDAEINRPSLPTV